MNDLLWMDIREWLGAYGVADTAVHSLLDDADALLAVVRKAEWNVAASCCPLCAMGKDQGHADLCLYATLPEHLKREGE